MNHLFDSCLSLHDKDNEVDWKGVGARLRPGAHVVSITSPLSHHVETARMEDAGFEIRDCLLYLSTEGSMMVGLGRVPLDGTVAQNVLKNGTGGLNIDGCRISATQDDLYFNRPLYQDRYEKSGITSFGGQSNWKHGDNSMPNGGGEVAGQLLA